jgi:hypothetical protein
VDAEHAAAEGAGVATAGVVGTAATLVAVVARSSPEWAEASAALGQAEALVRRSRRLAAENVERYAVVLRLLDEPGGGDLGTALEHSAEVPLRIAEAAADVASLATHAADHCEPRFRPDLLAAAAIAAGAAAAAAELVAANLTALEGDERVARARDVAAGAAALLRP